MMFLVMVITNISFDRVRKQLSKFEFNYEKYKKNNLIIIINLFSIRDKY